MKFGSSLPAAAVIQLRCALRAIQAPRLIVLAFAFDLHIHSFMESAISNSMSVTIKRVELRVKSQRPRLLRLREATID